MKIEAFKAWLARQGAEVLAPTNQYELLRVRAQSRVYVVYKKASGATTWPDFLTDCYAIYEQGGSVDMGLTKTPVKPQAKDRAALVERDGRDCFYCCQPMANDDMTVEHLVPRHKGGPDHLDNKALAHRACNQRVGNLPLVEKIKVRERFRVSTP